MSTATISTTIAVAGFTGKMSRLITDALLRTHPEAKIHGICRSASKVDPSISSHPNVTVFQAESTDTEALRAALSGTSACICCYLNIFDNTFMVDGQKTLIDACIAEAVPRYIASDWCMDFRGLPLGGHPAKDPMKLVHAYLEEKESEGKIKQVHVLTGGFMEFFFASFLGYVDAEKGEFTYYGTGDEKLDMTTMKDSANFTAEVAVDSIANGFLNFLGDRKSVKEMAQVYEKVYGVTPRVQNLGTQADIHEKMLAAFKSQPGNPFAWLALFYQYFQQEPSTLLGRLDNERYPSVKVTTLEGFLMAHTKDNVGNSFDF